MLKELFMFWWKSSLTSKLVQTLGIIVIAMLINCLFSYHKHNPITKMEFISNAIKNKALTRGQISCFSKNGYKKVEYYTVEYTYMVNESMYHVTYQIAPMNGDKNDNKDILGDLLAMDVDKFIDLYYDKNDPEKVMAKKEVLCSANALHKVKTKKNNMWRSLDNSWDTPINLVEY